MNETKIVLKTGRARRIVVIKDAVFSNSTGSIQIITALTVEPEPIFIVSCQDKGGSWQDMFVESPADLPLLLELMEERAQVVAEHKDYASMLRALVGLLKSSRTGLKDTVRAIQAKCEKQKLRAVC